MRTPTDFKSLINLLIDLINTATPVLAGIGILVFFWGLGKFIRNSGDAKNHEDGKNLMIWGVIGFFVMFAVWGLVRFAQSSLGFNREPFGIPTLPTNNR
jgi:hypothetical protein